MAIYDIHAVLVIGLLLSTQTMFYTKLSSSLKLHLPIKKFRGKLPCLEEEQSLRLLQ